jgi:hypothetical protein
MESQPDVLGPDGSHAEATPAAAPPAASDAPASDESALRRDFREAIAYIEHLEQRLAGHDVPPSSAGADLSGGASTSSGSGVDAPPAQPGDTSVAGSGKGA